MSLCVKGQINHSANNQTDIPLYKLCVQLSVCNKKIAAVYIVVLSLMVQQSISCQGPLVLVVPFPSY